MCCANKTFLVNFVLWLIALLGLAPMAEDWAIKFEDWTGVSLINRQPVVIQYYSEDDFSLHATIQAPRDWDDEANFPAVLTFHQTNNESQLAVGLSELLAEYGYVSILFEYPAIVSDVSADTLDRIAQAALRWTHENIEVLGINPSRIALWGRGDHDNMPSPLALHALTGDESEDAVSLTQPSVLFLISSRRLLEFEAADEEADHVGTALLLDDIQSGLPSTVLLVSDDATTEQLASAEQLLGKMTEMGNDCEIVVYEGSVVTRASEHPLEGEFEALATAMHEILRSIGFGNQ